MDKLDISDHKQIRNSASIKKESENHQSLFMGKHKTNEQT